MSATSRRAARVGRERTSRARFIVTQAILVDLVLAVGVVAVWPIYRSTAVVVTAAVGIAVGHLVAAAGTRWRWSGWWVALAALAAYIVTGVPAAAPGSFGSTDALLRSLVGVVTAPVTGWKDLLTLELPLGSYQTTLAPVLFVFVAATTAALSLAWRAARLWTLAAPASLVPAVVGVVFGARTLSAPIPLGPVRVQPEAIVGVAGLVAALLVVVWRTRFERRRALATAAAASGVRTTGPVRRGLLGRTASAVAMVAVAVTAAALWAPWALEDRPRAVARTSIAPVLEIERAPSPLGQYRASFADDAYDEELFRVDAPAGVDRIRLATLSFFDGRAARALDPQAGPSDPTTAYTRVPSRIDGTDGGTVEATVEIAGWRGIWMPTVGRLRAVAFEGARAADLDDGFFHNAATGAAVEIADPGFTSGDRYRLTAVDGTDDADLRSLTPARTGSGLPDSIVPDSLGEWVEAQGAPAGGQGLALLIDRLRARGYLSHTLLVPEGRTPRWAAELGQVDVQPSRAGHSTDRIGDLFRQLLDRQREVGDAGDAALVAGIGDDEQFAVAGMLLADHLGFDARIVVGTRLASSEELPVCDDGVCRGGDLAAWIEVRGAAGDWVSVDVTPQSAAFPDPDLEERRDPENPTEVRRDQAEPVLPAEADPADGAEQDDREAESGVDLGVLWTVLRVGGVSGGLVLLLFGPLALIAAAKAIRRRRRRRSPVTDERFAGGWEEYVDTAVDHGYDAPASATRLELAALWSRAAEDASGTDGERLARWADRAVFDASPLPDDEGDRFWEIVEQERSRFASEKGFWARWQARLSLRSLRRARPRPRGGRG